MHNIKIVDIGKSVHNIQFADKLLVGSYGIMKEALKIVGSTKSFPNLNQARNLFLMNVIIVTQVFRKSNVNAFGKTFFA